MIRLALLLLALTGPVMARDGNIQAPKNSAAPVDEEEQFWNSEMGQDLMQSFEKFQTGEKSFEQLRDEMSKKYGEGSGKEPPRTVPYAPIVRIK